MTMSETPLSTLQLHHPPGSTNAALQEKDETSKDVGLLAIPREIRNKIYQELLYLDEFRVQQFRAWRRLDPKILGVSRQIYHEASEILYDENGWVTLTAADWLVESLGYGFIESCEGFPGHSQPIKRHENDQLSKSAILDIKQQQDSDFANKMIDLVIPLAAMPRFCRLLSQSQWVDTLNLVLRFNHRAKDSHQSRLLGYLGQARGLQRVLATGAKPPWAVVNTVSLMMCPYKRMVDILNTMSAYQESSEHESKSGRTLAARNFVQDGADFVDWWWDEIRSPMARLEPIDDKDIDTLIQARADMGFSCASLSLRVGSIKPAQRAIECVLERLSLNQRLCETHNACAHYHMAQTFEAVGWKNAALYSYLQALRLRPGYQDADAAVDHMEQNLGSGTTLADVEVRHNIQHILDSFRHQAIGSAVINNRGYAMIFQKFAGTAAEIHSLDRSTREEADLIYMNPTYRKLDDDQDHYPW